MASAFSLSRAEKLKSRKLIALIFKEGKAFNVPPLRIITLTKRGNINLQAAFSVSSRNFKRAVDRNRIKRLMREAYRRQKKPLIQLTTDNKLELFLFFIYTGRELPDHNLVQAKIGLAIENIQKRTLDSAAGV